MGIDLRMCAVRLDSEPMVQIRTDEAVWQSAIEHPPFLWRSSERPLADVSRRLLAAVPDALALVWERLLRDQAVRSRWEQQIAAG